ncbi:hypothetical protein CFC21_070209 [Triticum aestivum]|uniref:TF-B3 domain-containing protein n=2 Tax=Triticum aestivum TaxID=4565 RepID=A0A3B6LFB4_WHEAT|nr:hypothetical protein CFC21_070209 [Triticum aestivum]
MFFFNSRAQCQHSRFMSISLNTESRSDQRMDKSCTQCKDYVAHQYWDHMDNRKKRFFKLMLGNFRNGVTIPEKFVRSVRGMISELVKLETPDGNTYNVHIAKELNNLVLRSGWSKFASVYELQEGDFLRFKYNGDSHFKVEIYDPSACEKETSCVVMNYNPGLQKRSVPHDNQMLSPEGERLAKRHNGCCSDSCKTSKMNPAGSPHKPTKKEVPSSEDARSSGELQTSTRSRYFLATGCNLTDAHKVEVDKIEQNIRPEIPLYVKTMSSASLVDGFLVICKDYAIKHLPCKDEFITFCHASHSKTWRAHYKINADDTYHLSTGWLRFVDDNQLQKGDTCMFEVLKRQRSFTMAVHLLKASYHHPPGFPASSKSLRPEAKSFRPEDKVRLSRFITLEGLLKTKVHEKVEVIKPEIPVFVSIMMKTNVSGRSLSLAFSLDYAKDFLPGENQIFRLHRPGESAPWKTEFKSFASRRWLVRGWEQFVIDNKLELDDVCLFERIENKKKLRMMVHIIRKKEYC